MLDIYCPGFCHRVNGSLSNMISILRDDSIEADSFILVCYEDGCEGVIQKKSVIGVRECGTLCKEEQELKIIKPVSETIIRPITINVTCDSDTVVEDIQRSLNNALKGAAATY